MTNFSRSDWGARSPRGGPGDLTPSRVEGLAFHWPAMSRPLRGFKAVADALRGWQRFHMDDKGWSDIAYQVAVDQDGNRYELRGLRTQSGANGDNDVNERFGAVLLILAPGEAVSDAMAAEVRRVVADHRALFPNSKRLVGHSDIRPEGTACPGPAALAATRDGTFNPVQEDEMTPAQEKKLDAVIANQERILKRLNLGGAIRNKLDRLLEQGKAERKDLAELRDLVKQDDEAGDASPRP